MVSPASATPLRAMCTTTSSGSCIRGGEFCPKADYGMTGTDASGDTYVCSGDTSHPHWQLTSGSGSGGSPTPAPTGSCRYTPVLPKRIAVNHSAVTVRTAVGYSGSAGSSCTKNFIASANLSRGDDGYFMFWSNSGPTDTQTVYPFEIHPGMYRLTPGDCDAASPDFSETYACSVAGGSTVIKFAGHASLTAKRLTGHSTGKVRFTAKALRANADSSNSPITTRASLQRYTGHGRWRTIHTATARGSKGWVFTYRRTHRATYRLVTAETAWGFSGISRAVSK